MKTSTKVIIGLGVVIVSVWVYNKYIKKPALSENKPSGNVGKATVQGGGNPQPVGQVRNIQSAGNLAANVRTM